VWGVLIALLVLVVAVQVLFAGPDMPLLPQAATVIGVAASLVAGLTLVWILDRPFNDRGAAIPPDTDDGHRADDGTGVRVEYKTAAL